MALLTPTPAEQAASGPLRHHNAEAVSNACRTAVRQCINTCRSLLLDLDRLVVAGGDLAAVQAALAPADFTVFQDCYNALRSTVIAVDPRGAFPASKPAAARIRFDPPDLSRDRTADIAAWTTAGYTTDAARSVTRIMAVLQRRCVPALCRMGCTVDQLLVRAGGSTAVQAIIGASDFTVLQTTYNSAQTVVNDIDATAPFPDFSRNRTAEIAQHQVSNPAP